MNETPTTGPVNDRECRTKRSPLLSAPGSIRKTVTVESRLVLFACTVGVLLWVDKWTGLLTCDHAR